MQPVVEDVESMVVRIVPVRRGQVVLGLLEAVLHAGSGKPAGRGGEGDVDGGGAEF
jgi:hypothetical protein